jgi:hypothetical protein
MQKEKSGEKFKADYIVPQLRQELELRLGSSEILHRVVRGRIGFGWKKAWLMTLLSIFAVMAGCLVSLTGFILWLDIGSPLLKAFLIVMFSIVVLSLMVMGTRRVQMIYGITSERIIIVGQHVWMYGDAIDRRAMRFTEVRSRGKRGDVILAHNFDTSIGLFDVAQPHEVAAFLRETYRLPEYVEPEKAKIEKAKSA